MAVFLMVNVLGYFFICSWILPTKLVTWKPQNFQTLWFIFFIEFFKSCKLRGKTTLACSVYNQHDLAFIVGDRAHEDVPPAEGFSLIHMHGELLKARCTRTGKVMDWRGDLQPYHPSPFDPLGYLRPHIVWFGEIPLEMERIEKALSECDLFVSIGTSGNVYPAAGFVQLAKMAGARKVELNLEPTTGASLFDDGHYGPATEVVPAFFNQY